MHLRPQRARIADAAHASEPARRKTELCKRVGKAGALEQKLGRMAAGSHDALHPRLCTKTSLARIFRQQTASYHHGGIGRRRAAGHRRDGDSPMRQLIADPIEFDVAGGIGIERTLRAHIAEGRLRIGRCKSTMGTARTGKARFYLGKVEFDDLAIYAGFSLVPKTLRLRILLDQFDLLLRAARQAQVFQRTLVDGEKRAGAAIFRRHVGDTGTLSGRKGGNAFAEALDKATDHAFLTQNLREHERRIHRRNAFVQCSFQMNADNAGNERRDGLAQSGCLGLDAADPPR